MLAFFVTYSIIMIWYSSFYIGNNNMQIKIYENFFSTISILLPSLISVYASLECFIEKKANNFQNIIGKLNAFFSKIIILTLNLFISLLLSTLIFLSYINLHFNINLSYKLFLTGALLTFIGSIPLIYIYVVSSLINSIAPTVCLGFFSTLISAILGATALGDHIWTIVPFTYPLRLAFIQFVEQMMNWSLVIPLLIGIIIILYSTFWFSKWEGNK